VLVGVDIFKACACKLPCLFSGFDVCTVKLNVSRIKYGVFRFSEIELVSELLVAMGLITTDLLASLEEIL